MARNLEFFITIRGEECIVEGEAQEDDPSCGVHGGIGDYTVQRLSDRTSIDNLTEAEQDEISERASEVYYNSDPEDYDPRQDYIP